MTGLEIVLPALLPAATDGIKALINKFTGGAGAQPANVDEALKMIDADTRRIEAMAKIDAVGNVSQWVANLRALQRPVASILIILAYIGCVIFNAPEAVTYSVGDYAGMVTFYMFGDRSYMYMKRNR